MDRRHRGSLQRIVLDEIALEGLEGITLPSLWVRLGHSLELPHALPTQLQQEIWSFILRVHQHLEFFELPVERETITYFDRYQNIDPYLGVPITPEVCPFVRYKCVPIHEDHILGSCENYKERRPIQFELLQSLDLDAVLKTWGKKFVIVASQDLRYNALTPANVPRPKDLTALQYCIWEAVGRSRLNGETTAGIWSLQHFCKDSTIVFYIKNKLIRHGVVAHQLFNEKRNERIIVSTLLTLPRFYSTTRSTLITMIEKLFLTLKEKPDHRMTLVEVRNSVPLLDRQKSLKKVMMTHLFRQIFETQSEPYREVFKDAKPKQNPSAKDRTVLIVSLRNPNLSVEELFAEETDQEKEEESSALDFYNEKHSFVDMPLRDEFYRAVARFGSRGCSQTEICSYICINQLTVRQLIKQMLNEGLIKSYCTDVGRQRINMYVAIEHADTVKKKEDDSMKVLKNLQCSEEPNIPDKSNDVTLADIPEISYRLKPYEYDGNNLQREGSTQRQVARKAFVVKTIDEQCLVQVSNLRKAIQCMEKEQGYKDEVCQKSVRRLLHHLSKSNIVRIYEIVLQCEEQIRIYRYVTHPKIDIEHKVLKDEILKLKNSFFLIMEERRQRRNAHSKEQRLSKYALKCPKKVAKVVADKKCKELMPLRTHKPPKFLISRYMHEFLFYIVVELNEYQMPLDISEELLERWKQSEPALQIAEYLSQVQHEDTNVKAFTRDISWRTFIPPLHKYSDKPAGWLYFMDAVDRMPLSIFNKIFRIEKGADDHLASYLTHPIRQHYLMRQLPVDLQCKISRLQLQKIYISVLKLLNNMGLVQVAERQNVKDPLIMWVYLNRRARILDTTSSEASYSQVNPEREYPAIPFEFNSFDDVHQYWTSLQRICVYTKLGFRCGKHAKVGPSKELSFVAVTDFDEAPIHDTGHLPGDCLGAAGLSTTLFAHTFRNWSWVVHSSNPLVKNVRTGRRAQMGSTRSKPNTKMVVQNVRKSRLHVPSVKRLQPGTAIKRGSTKKSAAVRDAIDRDALKNMRTLRVTWRKDEDEILKIARVVYLYVAAPIPALGLMTVGKICRDVIRHNMSIYNKTSQACVRRSKFLLKQRRHIPQVPTWLHLLQTNEKMQRKYGEQFLSKLKTVYPNRGEYCEALAIHFISIMCFLYKLIRNSDDPSQESRFLLPDSVAEFEKRFRERLPVQADEETIQYRNPETDFELQVAVVNSVLHSSLCCTRDKTLYNLQAFEIYKNFSEDVLHAAFAKARSDALVIALKRKHIQLIPSQLAGPAYLLSSKYRLRLMFLRIPYGVYDAFHTYFELILKTFYGATHSAKPEANGCLELRSPTLGQLFVMSEGLARNFLTSDVKLPINMLTVDAEQRHTVSPMDRMLHHYHSIFDNAPQTEYTKNLESESSGKQIRVKFHPANLSYKLHYTPYDFISKLPTRYLHFFCALDHLDKEVDINFGRLSQRVSADEGGADGGGGHAAVECPFDCILKQVNYINAIERIVNEKKSVLNDLSEMPPQKLLNLAASGCSVTVQPENLLTLVRMLESFWREKESHNERKDLGRLPTSLKATKTIDWHQLCNEILEYNADDEDNDKIEEYEPTLNKEERIVRAQDVFVVNLPTLRLGLSARIPKETDTVLHNGLMVPQALLETDQQREAILQKITKESFWKYTDNDIEKLKPQLSELGFNRMEQRHLEEIHDYIERHKLGVTGMELLREFPYEQFLLKALRTLAEHYLIKRVGVSTFMYVHKNHIRSWVIHTFNVKRLERENMGSSAAELKRTHESRQKSADEEDSSETAAKRVRLEADEAMASASAAQPEKRISKPVKRYEDTESSDTTKPTTTEREVIVMKPLPWMRLNGSLNRRVLDRWLGSILTECIARCGCSVHDICLRFPHMMPVDIMFLLEILIDLKCIHLTQIKTSDITILSEYEDIEESAVTELYDPEQTFIKAHMDAVMRMSRFIGSKKYNAEFI